MATAYWDISVRCNANCRYCYARPERRAAARRALPLPPLPVAIDHLRRAGVRSLVLLGGEPTLLPSLTAVIDHAQQAGLAVGIATNGLALDARLRRALLARPGVAVNFSLDSYFAEENDAVRGAGYHARCLGHLRALLAERRAAGVALPISIQVTLTRVNLARLEESLLHLADLELDVLLLDRMRAYAWQPRAVRALAPGPAAWVAGAHALARAARRHDGPVRIILNYGQLRLRALLAARHGYPLPAARGCPGGSAAAAIDYGGFLHPCRLVRQRPIPCREGGRPWYRIAPVHLTDPRAARVRQSAYFSGFNAFAHAGEVYRSLALCRECPFSEVCEPCPLDVVTYGPRAIAECRYLLEIGEATARGPIRREMRYRQREGVRLEPEAGGESLLVSPEGRPWRIANPAARLLWEALARGRTSAELAARLQASFPSVERSRLEADTGRFLHELTRRGLVAGASRGAPQEAGRGNQVWKPLSPGC